MNWSKYHAKKTVVEGMVFDSKAEAHRWIELRMLEHAGHIMDLQRQVPFELIPQLKRKDGHRIPKTVYKADFVYTDLETGETVVEDVKGFATPEYRLKKKLMLWKYGVEIKEVKA